MPVKLVLRNITAHWVRSALTLGSVLVAVFLLCVLTATTRSLTSSVEQASTNRLWVQSAVSLFVDLPLSYGSKIAAVPGVQHVCRWQWFGGSYRDADGFFAQFGVDPETFQASYPEMEVTDGTYDAFARDRVGCLVGVDLADKYGWKVGDSVPILGSIFKRNGNEAWEFTVRGLYRSKSTSLDQQTLFFHYDYLRESLEQGAAEGPEGVGVYMVQLQTNTEPTGVMRAIDTMFENGPQRVQATTEGEFQRQFLSMLGNVPTLLQMIGGAVLFAIFFAVLNTMLMAARERVRSVGIMKALGYSDGAVRNTLLLEAVLLCGTGGGIAVALAWGMQSGMARSLSSIGIGNYAVSNTTALIGIGISLGLGLVAGLLPGWQMAKITPVTALRREA